MPHGWGARRAPQKLPARLGTPHPVFTAPRAHPGLRQPHPSPLTAEVRQEKKGLGTSGSRKDPPRWPDPAPGAGQGPHPAFAQPCPSPPLLSSAQSLAGNPHPQRPPCALAAPGSHTPCAWTPSPQCGWASTSLATSTRTEHYVGAGSTARQAPRLLSAPFTVLGLRRSRARSCSASAASRAQGWLEVVSQPHVPPHSHSQPHTCAGTHRQQQLTQAASPQ